MDRFFLLCTIAATAFAAHAWAMPKAYEVVKFTAASGPTTFLLNYADGYNAGNEIRVTEKGQEPVILEADSVPEKNIQIFHDPKSTVMLILSGLHCDALGACNVPTRMPATYTTTGKTTTLLFTQK